jgi:hypothetical protein
LGKLIKIEAGLEEGVEVAPFDLQAWHRDEQRIVGVPIAEGEDSVVLRRKATLSPGTILGEALTEVGRAYGVLKLRQLKDLTPAGKRMLEYAIRQDFSDAVEDDEARFCSEVVARSLQFARVSISPNELANIGDLGPVPSAVRHLDDHWTKEATTGASTAITSKLRDLRGDWDRRGMGILKHAVELIRNGGNQALIVEALQCAFERGLQDDLQRLEAIRELEPSVLTSIRQGI